MKLRRIAVLLAVFAFAAVLPGCATKKALRATNDRLGETRTGLIHAFERIKGLQASIYCHMVVAHNMAPIPNPPPPDPPYPSCPGVPPEGTPPPPPPRNWP